MLKLLAQKENQKNSTQDDGVKLLHSYADNYELTIIEKDTRAANTAWVQVKVSREKDFRYFDIDVPATLSRQLSYHDFDKAYGSGIETPRPKEPLDFNTMYHAPGAGKVTIIVTSEQPPQTTKPGIYRITVML